MVVSYSRTSVVRGLNETSEEGGGSDAWTDEWTNEWTDEWTKWTKRVSGRDVSPPTVEAEHPR